MGLWPSVERVLRIWGAVLEGGLAVLQFFQGKKRMHAQDSLAENECDGREEEYQE
jgi:hypothetical protein